MSPFGLGMSAREVPAIGERIRLALRLEGARLDLHGTIVRMHQTGEGTSTVGVAFDPLASEAADTITRSCFQHPFGPDARSDRRCRPAGTRSHRSRRLSPAPPTL